jgi:hypothetical protein
VGRGSFGFGIVCEATVVFAVKRMTPVVIGCSFPADIGQSFREVFT